LRCSRRPRTSKRPCRHGYPALGTLSYLDRARGLAKAWGSRFVELGEVGHLNPASGYGEWPQAKELIHELS
jgi:hypothetical protein